MHNCWRLSNENGIIILDVDGEFAPMEYEQNGHWGRVLCRALRFSEQYEWLILSDKVEVQVNKFKEYLDSNIFTNNLAEGEAGVKEEHNNENVVESIFAENEEIQKKFDFFAGNKVYRQLSVGFFIAKMIDFVGLIIVGIFYDTYILLYKTK